MAMTLLLKTTFVIAGLIHLLPLTGFLGVSQLQALYGIRIEDPNLSILMRHRAVLFALLGSVLIAAAFKPNIQTVAIFMGLISTVSFLWLALSVGNYNPNLSRVVHADIAAICCLLIAGGILIIR